MKPTFEQVLAAWTDSYNDKLPRDRKDRKKAFINLLVNLKDYGFDQDSLTTSVKEAIIRRCVNPNHPNKQKLKVWISMVVCDLEDAILIYYGNCRISKIIT